LTKEENLLGLMALEPGDAGAGRGSIRFTRKDQQGEWCSRECREALKPLETTARLAKARGPGSTERTANVWKQDASKMPRLLDGIVPSAKTTPQVIHFTKVGKRKIGLWLYP